MSLIEGVRVRTPASERSDLSPSRGTSAKDPSVCPVPVFCSESQISLFTRHSVTVPKRLILPTGHF